VALSLPSLTGTVLTALLTVLRIVSVLCAASPLSLAALVVAFNFSMSYMRIGSPSGQFQPTAPALLAAYVFTSSPQ